MIVATTVDRAEEEGNTDVDVSFKPRNKTTDVDVDSKIILTFTTSMKLKDGKAITASNIKDFVSLKLNSKGGDDVDFTAEINSARKVITLTPTSELSTSTRYYVVLKDEALINAGGTENEGASAYFTTSSKGGSTSASFSPQNGATGVSASTSITVRFTEDVVKYSDGGEVTSAYLQECVQLKSGSASGANVTFTASISSSDTITITPSANLTASQAYYVAIVANKLKTKSGGKAIPAASATWTVAAAAPPVTNATLSTLTLAPSGGSNVLTGFSAATLSYDVTVPFGTTGVDVAATAASGTAVTINSTATTSAVNIPVNGSAITTITVNAAASGMTASNYQLRVEVAGNTSLSGIAVNGIALLPVSGPFATHVATSATSAAISVTAVDPAATITLTGGASGTGSLLTNVNLVSDSQSFSFDVISNRTTKTYTIHISRQAP
jgi:hypothetical protein